MSKNKTILIIGAKSDIAVAVAHKFASEGYNLQLAARNSSELDKVVSDLKIRYEISVSVYELDILKYETYTDFIDSLDCLPEIALCAVGILGNQTDDEKSFSNSSLVMRTNYEGPSLLLGEIANRFETRGSGSIIGISSVAGDRGRASNYIYGSAKSGFTAFLSGLRNRLYKSNLKVLTILPGFVETKMTKGLQLPNLITASPKSISCIIYQNKHKSKVVYPLLWHIIMFIVRSIPEVIFKRIKL
tara:strand:- start:1606 stop:2340 length:735 start_codon:yes stop_codon:yes gene_type:complete